MMITVLELSTDGNGVEDDVNVHKRESLQMLLQSEY